MGRKPKGKDSIYVFMLLPPLCKFTATHLQTPAFFLISRQQYSSYSNGNALETVRFPLLWQKSGQELPS